MAKKRLTVEDEALLAELGVEAEAKKQESYTAREERIIAGFEEIQRFFEEHGRLPQHGENRDIFERIYAVRMDRIRASEECMTLLAAFDTDGLLNREADGAEVTDDLSDEELLAELGVEASDAPSMTELKHVRPSQERKAAEEIARRERCADFEQFHPIFEQVQADLDSGRRKTAAYKENAAVEKGEMFILAGQKALIADMDELFKTEYDRENRRLRVIFDNGTEGNLLLRSFQRALWKNENSRRILPSDDDVPALFLDQLDEDDTEPWHIYVLLSMSDHPVISEHRKVIHKIGVTGSDVKRRIANAKKDPTFLLADVEIVTPYKLANINRVKLENLLHRFFDGARLDLNFRDRFGSDVRPREWFLVPLPVIEEAIELLKQGKLERYKYDVEQAKLVKR